MIFRVVFVCVVLGALFGCGARMSGTGSSEAERTDADGKAVQELKPELPAYPQDRDLVEFFPGPLGSHRYFIDAKSLSIGNDGIVRYSVVVKTSGGATNVAYEGIRCSSGEKRLYAMGDRHQKWMEAKRSDWEPIRTGKPNAYQGILFSEYFCPDRAAVLPDRETALRALRSGRRESEMRGDHL